MHITALYAVIPNNKGLQALKYFFNQRAIKKPSSETSFSWTGSQTQLFLISFGDNYLQTNQMQWEPKWDLPTPTSS